MNTTPFRRLGTALLLPVMFCATPASSIPASAAGVLPKECNDREQTGTNIPSGWAFVLNFETGIESGCLISVKASGSRVYERVVCTPAGEIGVDPERDGRVIFQPGATLTCDIEVRMPEAIAAANRLPDYWMTAAVTFPESGEFNLINYDDTVNLRAFVSGGMLRMDSRYYKHGFSHTAVLGYDNGVYARSLVPAGFGHQEFTIQPRPNLAPIVSRSWPEPVNAFEFPSRGRLIIGSPDSKAAVIIDELVIDPSGRCCSGG
jgi:hypothetical protein